MKKSIILSTALALSLTFSCDLIDGTGVENPNLTLDGTLALPNPTAAWVNGSAEQLATTANNCLTTQELATDNYENVQTFFNQNVDNGTYRDIDTDFRNCQIGIHTLREQVDYAFSDVLPADPAAAGTTIEAELYYYRAIANLWAGESFTALPGDALSATVGSSAHFTNAIDDLTSALAIDNTSQGAISYLILRARANYGAGNQAAAVSDANAAITLDGDDNYVRYIQFDGTNGPTNTIQNALHDRGNFDDIQPLPRLDFLDPKFFDIDGVTDSNVPIAKIEEAYLIIAEAELAGSNLGPAQTAMTSVVTIATARGTNTVDDSGEGRLDPRTAFQRPNASTVTVRSTTAGAYTAGLVLDRTATLETPSISGTSMTAADVTALTAVNALENLYLLRQHIFFAEGRRMFDLGIKFPTVEREALINPNIVASDRVATIPSYLPSIADFDTFTIDSPTQVTVTLDLNAEIASGRGNRF